MGVKYRRGEGEGRASLCGPVRNMGAQWILSMGTAFSGPSCPHPRWGAAVGTEAGSVGYWGWGGWAKRPRLGQQEEGRADALVNVARS